MLRLAAVPERELPALDGKRRGRGGKGARIEPRGIPLQVQYIVAHGISSTGRGQRSSSQLALFEDEGRHVPAGDEENSEVYAEVLPEDKAAFIRAEKSRRAHGNHDRRRRERFPRALEADAGIAISTGAAIAREIADITIASEDLFELVTLRRLPLN